MNRLIRLFTLPLFFATTCSTVFAQDALSPTTAPLTPAGYSEIQARLDTFKIRDDGKHHTPRKDDLRTEKRRQMIQASIAALDARQIQASSVLKLQALILTTDDLRLLSQLKNIRLVSLHRCTITAEGFAHIADAWHESLEQLTLSYVDVVGGKSIANSAGKLKRIELLTINRTAGIGMDVIRAMAAHPITAIDMNRPSQGIDPKELFEVLGNEYKSLRKLDLHHWQKQDELRAVFRAKRPEVEKGKVRDRIFGTNTISSPKKKS